LFVGVAEADGAMFGVFVATLMFVAGLAYMMRVDVRRMRMRDQILAIADPSSDLYRRNLPQKTTRWGMDNAVADAWSRRVIGVWWFARAAYCLAAGLLIAGLFAWIQSYFKQSSAALIVPVAASPQIWLLQIQVRKTEADLAVAVLQSEHARSVAGT
jgi:hypothetical protein